MECEPLNICWICQEITSNVLLQITICSFTSGNNYNYSDGT